MDDLLLKGLLFILGFGSVIFLTYVTTKYIANKSVKTMHGKYMKIIDTISLGMDKRLYLVKVDNQFFLIASSGKTIEFLSEISVEEKEDLQESTGSDIFNFKKILEKYVYLGRQQKTGEAYNDTAASDMESKQYTNPFSTNLKKLRELNRSINAKDKINKDDDVNES